MSERNRMRIDEFVGLVRSDDKLRGIDYLNSPVKGLWERSLSAIAFALVSPVIAVQAVELIAADGWPIYYDMSENNFPVEMMDALSKKGRKVSFHKVRSMENNAESEEGKLTTTISLAQLEKNGDNRVVPVRRKWRKSRMDELPQFGDVAVGRLNLIGTRMNTRSQWEKEVLPNKDRQPYSEFYQLMTSGEVMPGVLGAYWLLGGKDVVPEERYRGEVEYTNNASLTTDWKIIWKTIGDILGARRMITSKRIEEAKNY